MSQPSVIISQDLSGIGQVSMGVALPLLAALDFAPYCLPTAVLSTHTGFKDSVGVSLAPQMQKTLLHWQSLAIKPAGLLLGYLGQPAMPVWRQAIGDFAQVPVRVIDPVMGDHGQLYRGFDLAYVRAMQQLVRHATVITPNATEASLLLDQKPPTGSLTAADAAGLATATADAFAVPVVLTGVELADGKRAIFGAEPKRPAWQLPVTPRPGHYFGTGDIFASVVCGGLMAGMTIQTASQIARDFIDQALQTTLAQRLDVRFGVNYMAALPWLLQQFRG